LRAIRCGNDLAVESLCLERVRRDVIRLIQRALVRVPDTSSSPFGIRSLAFEGCSSAFDTRSSALDDRSFAFDGGSWHVGAVPSASGRVLLHLERDLRRAVDAGDIYSLEAVGETSLVRLRPAHELRDTRSLGELMAVLSAFGIVRVHRNHAVNLRHVAEIRRRDAESGWEVALAPPVNRVLPVGRTYLARLWAAFGEGRARRR
jgi:hypothetical protein